LKMPVALLRPDWPAPTNVRSACALRGCGVSVGPYASLNLAAHVGDETRAVVENRRLLSTALTLPAEPLWLTQVHGVTVVDADVVGRLETGKEAPIGDAAVTREPGRVLTVMVADCLPVLFCKRDGTAVAVAHAGWRGLSAGILEAAVAALGGPVADVLAWLGPAIGPDHFEVGEEVRRAFCDHDARAAAAFTPHANGRWLCDLYRLARQRLESVGLNSIHGEVRSTYAQPDSLFSFRRDGITGRIAALIWMQPGGPDA
jgi:YfiH family protein